MCETLGAVAGLFDQLARAGLPRIFTVINAAGDELPQKLPCGMAILPDQQHAPVRQNREHHDRAGVRDDFARGPYSAGLDHFVAPDPKYRTLVNYFAAQNFCFVIFRAAWVPVSCLGIIGPFCRDEPVIPLADAASL